MPTPPEVALRRLARRRCIPLTVTMEVTLRCPLRCSHCYNFDRSGPPPAHGSLSETEVLELIDQLRDAGCLTLAFTGGEVLTHPAIDRFVARAAARRMAVGLKTNGALLDRGRARRLAEAGCSSVQISLYGGTAAVHDGFTGVPGSFERTLGGIAAAREAGMSVSLSMPLVRTNAHEVERMLGWADRLGVPARFDPQITARTDGTAGPLDLRVDRATLERLYAGPLREMLPSPCFDPGRGVQCNCARSVCGITSSGEVVPCIGAPLPAGNVRDRPFLEIWRDSPVLNRIRGLTLEDFPACKPCPDRPFCRRSSGVVWMNTGDYTGAEPWTCMEAAVCRQLAASS